MENGRNTKRRSWTTVKKPNAIVVQGSETILGKMGLLNFSMVFILTYHNFSIWSKDLPHGFAYMDKDLPHRHIDK